MFGSLRDPQNTPLLHIWVLNHLKKNTGKKNIKESISTLFFIKMILENVGIGLPINEPQNWANITIQQCCMGTFRKVKDCNASISAIRWRSSACIQEECVPCKVVPVAGKSISGQFLWENFLRWLNSPCSNYVLTKPPSEDMVFHVSQEAAWSITLSFPWQAWLQGSLFL